MKRVGAVRLGGTSNPFENVRSVYFDPHEPKGGDSNIVLGARLVR